MLKRSRSKPGLDTGAQGNRSDALAAIDALYAQEMKDNIAALRERRRIRRHQQSMSRLVEYWPVAVGIILSFFAPQVRDLLAPVGQWAMWLIFPFVVIAQRPEIYMGDQMAVILPMVMLYIQFPLEGLLAKIALKGNVTISGVAGQFLFYHLLGVTELWLVNGVLQQILKH
jgi:hypothetical protein